MNNSEFDTRFAKLNDNQQEAVKAIHGPLLVIAGPGTGKTELLSMRAAQILRETDALPSNILCLTFTESGASNMRQRLIGIIGEDAYKVGIHTFHSFGTEIIGDNREYFFKGSGVKPADDLMQQQILTEIFETLDWKNPLAKKNLDEFVYLTDTLRAVSDFKQSGLSPEEIRQVLDSNARIFAKINDSITKTFEDKISKASIEKLANLAQEAASLNADKLPEGLVPYVKTLAPSIARAANEALESGSTKPVTAWRNAWCKKDAHQNFVLKDSLQLEKLYACVDIYENYTQKLREQKLFDYDDMILSVLKSLDKNADLLANLQEKYQFIMVDEFQDTNLAQLRLLFKLTSGEQPNVMAVGDDDQAIFSFQGADINNIKRFREKYPDHKIVVLKDNYRSDAEILKASRRVIIKGEERLEDILPDLTKELTPHVSTDRALVKITEFASPLEERAGVAQKISQLLQAGEAPQDIAILAKRHYELVEMLPYLSKQGIRVNYERQDDALKHPVVKLIELISRVIVNISDNKLSDANALLPELIAHQAFGYSTKDIWSISLNSFKNRQLWLEAMLASSVFSELAKWLLDNARKTNEQPLETQLDVILEKIADFYFNTDKLNNDPEAYLSALESLRTVRDKLLDHYDSAAPTLKNLVEFIDLHRLTHTSIKTKRARAEQASDAINLMTAHKAKGLEFRHVFIIGAVDDKWGEKVREKSSLISYPANLPLAKAGGNYNERLRLFFVAMTRAKTTLNISFSSTASNGKSAVIAEFLSSHAIDTAPNVTDIAQTEELLITDWRARLVSPITADLKSTLAPILDNYKLSATHLNNFLDISRGGPQDFLLKNLLQFPSAKSPSAAYGTAIHTSLQFAHDLRRADGKMPEIEAILDTFSQELASQHLSKADYETFSEKGKEALSKFINRLSETFTESQTTETNFAYQNVVLGSAKLTGKLDLIDLDKQAKTIFVTDYKTGRPSSSWKGKADYEKIKLHKYRQQLMFYQILVNRSRDYSGYEFTGAKLQFVEPDQQTDQILSLEASFSDEELAEFTQLVEIVWQRIMALDLPDTSGYSSGYKGMVAFEQDLLESKV